MNVYVLEITSHSLFLSMNFRLSLSLHFSFDRRSLKMFSRVIRNYVRNEFLGKKRWELVRTIFATPSSLNRQNYADNSEDIIVSSPLPSINYPDLTIDQFVFNDINNWSKKTALVKHYFYATKLL